MRSLVKREIENVLSTDEAIDVYGRVGNKLPLADIRMDGKDKLIRLAL